MSTQRTVVYIGGRGHVAKLATPKLVAAGHTVTSVIRRPEQADEVTALGATALVQDITALDRAGWEELLAPADVVVWGAGNGGRGGPEITQAVDRDAALQMIDALEALGERAPRLLMISYRNATRNTAPDDGGTWHAYVEAKKAVDLRLGRSSVPHLILGPGMLTDEPARGVRVVPDDDSEQPEAHTSRELVADVLTEMVGRDHLPAGPLAFLDGDDPVSGI
ncbi:NAD(P)H-binding protein [Brachybacterium sp. EF45031]|uniref:NAD(P)H-binding protein n=1 Tax=Brachybacterium sillae TaxID=2810536 RepID=UPI00217CE5E5|nr:NAD(P)H-binding protein [Brachybacterium sillae]MCS6712238.1 NAD(P)H-binding protein [Brachybacterium sillae]